MSRLNLRSEDLPTRVDLARGVIIARNQGMIGSCGSFATSNALTLMLRQRDRLPVSNRSFYSPSFLYNQIMIGNDQGSTYYDNLELAANAGISTVITFPYTQNVNLQPGINAFRDAGRNKISEWRKIQHDDVNTFRSFLAKGFPILVSINVYPNFFSYSGGIFYPEGSPDGLHAVVITGYEDSDRTFTALNSWGEPWGGDGSFKLAYNALNSRDPFVLEAYILVPAAENSETPAFPAKVEASKGTRKDTVVVRWEAVPGALGYEIFRLDSVKPSDPREEMYVSLGMTSGTVFEDAAARQDHRFFYMVRTHTEKISSDLSFPAEGWSSSMPNNPPGPPSGFHAIRQNDTVVCGWDRVENADRYSVYSWRSSD